VLDAIGDYYKYSNANVHRGVHHLSEKATALYEGARQKVAGFINAVSAKECIFTRGTTESVNLVAQGFVLPRLKAGDEVLVTYLEHHSNIVPWQMICDKVGARLIAAPINEQGEVQLNAFAELISEKTRFISVSHISNALGTINPIQAMIALAKDNNIPIMIDGAQAAPHVDIDVQMLGCDFYAFSGHKMYGPTGIGALWGRESLLNEMSPVMGGGDMITQVTFDKSYYAPLPAKFEAGTPNIAGAVGLGAAIDYILSIGIKNIAEYEQFLLSYATEKLLSLDGFEIIGTAPNKASVLSFVHENIHPHDMGTILDSKGIAIRSGHHCAMPIMDFFDVPATTRASFAFYNTPQEIDVFISGLKNVVEVFS
jgi:cysteine desulfurase/selenocysteine lyase